MESESQMQKTADNLDSFIQKINLRLEYLIDNAFPETDVLSDAVKYSLLSKAKRLRPSIVIATGKAFNVPEDISIDPACCIEMIHTYSLIHDDLPSMDDDDYRRGKPSLHVAYNEAIAILAGDFLLTYPFEVLANLKSVSAEKKINLVKVLANRSGGNELIKGQVIDLTSEGKDLPQEMVEKMHLKKTASMILASLEFAAVLGDASQSEITILQEIGKSVGLAFQIKDDILDVTSSTDILGKPAKSDVINKKATFVTCIGIDKAKVYVDALKTKSVKLLNSLNRNTLDLEQLIENLFSKKA